MKLLDRSLAAIAALVWLAVMAALVSLVVSTADANPFPRGEQQRLPTGAVVTYLCKEPMSIMLTTPNGVQVITRANFVEAGGSIEAVIEQLGSTGYEIDFLVEVDLCDSLDASA